jgi:hypothetical protein
MFYLISSWFELLDQVMGAFNGARHVARIENI